MLYHDVNTKVQRLLQQNGEVSLKEATLFIEADTETYRDYSIMAQSLIRSSFCGLMLRPSPSISTVVFSLQESNTSRHASV
jgi:hypothetical protein